MMLRSWSGIGRTKRRACCFGFRFRSGLRSGEFVRTRLVITECGKRKLPCKYIEMQRRTAEREEKVAATRRKNFTIIKGGRS